MVPWKLLFPHHPLGQSGLPPPPAQPAVWPPRPTTHSPLPAPFPDSHWTLLLPPTTLWSGSCSSTVRCVSLPQDGVLSQMSRMRSVPAVWLSAPADTEGAIRGVAERGRDTAGQRGEERPKRTDMSGRSQWIFPNVRLLGI